MRLAHFETGHWAPCLAGKATQLPAMKKNLLAGNLTLPQEVILLPNVLDQGQDGQGK